MAKKKPTDNVEVTIYTDGKTYAPPSKLIKARSKKPRSKPKSAPTTTKAAIKAPPKRRKGTTSASRKNTAKRTKKTIKKSKTSRKSSPLRKDKSSKSSSISSYKIASPIDKKTSTKSSLRGSVESTHGNYHKHVEFAPPVISSPQGCPKTSPSTSSPIMSPQKPVIHPQQTLFTIEQVQQPSPVSSFDKKSARSSTTINSNQKTVSTMGSSLLSQSTSSPKSKPQHNPSGGMFSWVWRAMGF